MWFGFRQSHRGECRKIHLSNEMALHISAYYTRQLDGNKMETVMTFIIIFSNKYCHIIVSYGAKYHPYNPTGS